MIELPSHSLLTTLYDSEPQYDENIRKIRVKKHKSVRNDTIWVDTFSIYRMRKGGYIFEYSIQISDCWEKFIQRYELNSIIPRVKQLFGAHYYQYIVGFWMLKQLDLLDDIRLTIRGILEDTVEGHNKQYEFHYLQ
jgi:hypothetical protein